MTVFPKQPADVIDIDVDYSSYLPSTDTIASATATVDTGLTLGSTVIDTSTDTVKQWVSGGTTANRYKVSVTMTSTEGRVKQVDFYVKVKEL